MQSDDMLLLGIDPSSVKIAAVAHYPTTRSYFIQKYSLGKKSGPDVCYAALGAMYSLLDAVGSLALPTTQKFAFVEAPLVGRGGVRSTMVQAFTSGVIQACLVQAGFAVYMVHPSTWKAAVCGNGNADKADVGRAVAARWPRCHRTCDGDTDLQDAAGLALYGHDVARRGQVVAKRGSLSGA